MAQPALVYYASEAEYRQHYLQNYCRANIQTFDGLRVFFQPNQFDHCFFESSARDGRKDLFSTVRAERIDWIVATLENPNADLYQGWDKGSRCYDSTRRVAVVYEQFVVVVAMGINQQGVLRANFVTCYQADNSIARIRTSPSWSRQDCENQLRGVP